MNTCTKCSAYGLGFNRNYKPEEFIEGDPNSPIWIIGINPSNETSWIDERSPEDLRTHFADKEKIHSYFKDFDKVSPFLFNRLGTPGGVAHTDMVKCSSRSFPPEAGKGINSYKIVENCSQFLEQQIKTYKPRLLICNGANVCEYILSIFPPKTSETSKQTNYLSELDGKPICIVLSGFIGRIDDYSKRRLGVEVEKILEVIKLLEPNQTPEPTTPLGTPSATVAHL